MTSTRYHLSKSDAVIVTQIQAALPSRRHRFKPDGRPQSWSGTVHVAFVIDVFARRIVGWRVSTSMTTRFVPDAFEQALWQRKPLGNKNPIHHSDRGSRGGLNRSSQHGQFPHSRAPRPVPPPGFSTRVFCEDAR